MNQEEFNNKVLAKINDLQDRIDEMFTMIADMKVLLKSVLDNS